MTGELAAHKEETTLELVGKNEKHAQMPLHKLLGIKVSREKNCNAASKVTLELSASFPLACEK